jgi:23S rRNA (guanosine2251-2'-O)-methyltransferase
MAPRPDSRPGGPSRDARSYRNDRPASDRRSGSQGRSRSERDSRGRRDWKRDGERSADRDQDRRPRFSSPGPDGPPSSDRGRSASVRRLPSRSPSRSSSRSPSLSSRQETFGRQDSRRQDSRRLDSRFKDSRRQDNRFQDSRFKDSRFQDSRNQDSRRRFPDQRRQPTASSSQALREGEPEAAASVSPPDDLLWGRHATQAALESGRPIHRIWCTPEMRSAARFLQLLRDAKASGVLVEEVTWARLGQITGGSVHQGIALQTAAAKTLDLEGLISGCADLGEAPLLLALDGVTDPHNLGAVVRSAEAMGAHGVVLPQRRSAGLTGSVAKVAAGALEHMPVARVVNLNRSLEKLKDSGYRVIGLASEGDVTLMDADLDGPLVLVTGSEGQGLSLLTRRHCDQLVRIPLRGSTPSLNASVATALCVYEVARRSWMKDIHGQAPSPPISRPKTAAAVEQASDPDVSLPVEPVEEERIELDLNPSGPPDAIRFDQSIQLSP